MLDIRNIKFENYKCFKIAEINEIKNINIIIGKNNIGKSSILDVIEMIYGNKKNLHTTITIDKLLSEKDINRTFYKNTISSDLRLYNCDNDFGRLFINKLFSVNV